MTFLAFAFRFYIHQGNDDIAALKETDSIELFVNVFFSISH